MIARSIAHPIADQFLYAEKAVAARTNARIWAGGTHHPMGVVALLKNGTAGDAPAVMTVAHAGEALKSMAGTSDGPVGLPDKIKQGSLQYQP
jgi:hypothetical protein